MQWTSKLRSLGFGAAFILASFQSSTTLAKHQDLHMSVIYGEDNRLDLYEVQDANWLHLADSTVALIRASDITVAGDVAHLVEDPIGEAYRLCPTERFYHQNSAAFCSGFLVAPDTIVTAGHCIRSQSACDSTRFVFGFAMHSENDRANQVPANEVYQCERLVHSVVNNNGEDFAVVKLNRSVTGHQPLSLAPQTSPAGTDLTVIGHPSGIPTKVSGGAEVRQVKPQHLVANLDTYGGNSGSAVFESETGLVAGILVRGEADYIFVNGCRKSNVCTNSGCRGEDVTLIKQTFPYLEQ